jgi:hypothetical protein
MRVSIKSATGVYRLIDIQCDVEHELENATTERQRAGLSAR